MKITKADLKEQERIRERNREIWDEISQIKHDLRKLEDEEDFPGIDLKNKIKKLENSQLPLKNDTLYVQKGGRLFDRCRDMTEKFKEGQKETLRLQIESKNMIQKTIDRLK